MWSAVDRNVVTQHMMVGRPWNVSYVNWSRDLGRTQICGCEIFSSRWYVSAVAGLGAIGK